MSRPLSQASLLSGLESSAIVFDWNAAAQAGTVIAFTGRLDEREQLAVRLGLTQELPPDPALVLLAYQRWGRGFTGHLLGDFSFVLFDQAQKNVFCVRDALGARSLFYAQNGTQLIVSASLSCLLDHPSVERRLNHRKLAINAIVWRDGSPETFYQGVYALAAGSALCFSAKGVEIWPYWEPDPEARLDIPDADVSEALRTLLFKAIGDRLPATSTPAALLSGGLDSSSIVAVAAAILKQQNRRLLTLSAVLPAHLRGQLVDETSYIRAFSGVDNLDRLEIADERYGPFDRIASEMPAGLAPFIAANGYQYQAFDDAAREHGAESIFCGNYGEYGPTHASDGFYVEQFLSGHWRTLSAELYARARVTGLPLWKVVASTLLTPLAPAWIKHAAGRNYPKASTQMAQQQPLQADYLAKYLTESREALTARAHAALKQDRHPRATQARYIASYQKTHGRAGLSQSDVALCHPLLDRRVIEFCLAAPTHLKVRNGYPRSLVRWALDGLLPPSIQWRTCKEPFAPDFHLRYNRQRPIAEQFLASIAPNDPVREVVDVPRLQTMVKHEMRGNRGDTPADFIAMHAVPRGVYLIHFLRQFSEFSVG